MEDRLQSLIVPTSARLIDAVQVIKDNKSRCAVVVDGRKVAGVISEGDIMRALLHGVDVHAPLSDWMNHGFKFLSERDLQAALVLMRKHGITLVPVLDADFGLADVVTVTDVLEQAVLPRGA